jgi:hypothetical protein
MHFTGMITLKEKLYFADMKGLPACKLGECKFQLQFEGIKFDLPSHFRNNKWLLAEDACDVSFHTQ